MANADTWPYTPTRGLIVPAGAIAPADAAQLVGIFRASMINDEKVRLRDEVDSSVWQDSIARSNFAVARTRDAISRLLHYGHPIPVSRGLTAEYVDTHFPGWTWNGLIEALRATGIVINSKTGALACDPGVGAVHFDGTERWVVEWEDGRVTTSPGEAASDQCFT